MLKTGPDLAKITFPVSDWGVDPITEIEFSYSGKVEKANTCVLALNEHGPFFFRGIENSSEPALHQLTASFSPRMQTCDLKVGVANGKWSTVGILKVAPKPDLTDPGKRTELVIAEGMALASVPGKKGYNMMIMPMKLAGAPRTNVLARRFVAVLRSGKEVVLVPNGHGEGGKEIYEIARQRGEGNYQMPLESDIKEILFETRPYEWTTFNNISLHYK